MEVLLDNVAIQNILPHRYPFLLVDRILEMDDETGKVIGLKNVTLNESFFVGHFPGHPVMPGVLIIESMAQVAGVLLLSKAEQKGKLAYFTAIDNARFRKVVVPGDQLRMEVQLTRCRSKTGVVQGKAFVGDQLAAEADLMFALVGRTETTAAKV
ncbi:MAG: 3-hydroxyacyl-ACP dehydratase FabZ [Chlamydiae bacterium]|nr:3-hydroxyacyl-ACP dehydratase FabZ [Chlamydiota bacterium]MBI3277545.1 3-hydroxyacyl-ACP dehydratase FabZ [Chlamydiota bacterium]